MALIADGLLIATCLTAALYCYVLSRRLKQFTSTEDGVGKQIRDLNGALEEIRGALKDAQEGAASASAPLAREIQNARKLLVQLKGTIAEAENREGAPPRVSTPSVAADVSVDQTSGAAKPAKLEAVSHGAQQAQSPVADLGASADDADEIDPGEINLDEMLSGSTGEQQLGFLPDEGEANFGDDEGKYGDVLVPSNLESAQTGVDSADSVERAAEATTPRPRKARTEDVRGDNLLKVERMAL